MPTSERLTTRILHPHDPTPSTEDIFSSALETLFTDDTQQSHGVPGQSIIYRSPRFGDVYLRIPVHPDEEGGRLLFAHYLWNAGVVCAEAIEQGSRQDDDGTDGQVDWDKRFWDMRGMDVLELGAATALPSLISTLSDARTVVSTDHPSSPAITMNAIESNFKINVTERGSTSISISASDNGTKAEREYTDLEIPALDHPPVTTNTSVSVYGYTWGTEKFYLTGGFGKLATEQPALRSFDRIIVADCLWMPAQHVNLIRTVLWYLKDAEEERKQKGEAGNKAVPCALVIAGFHTGRPIVKDFVEIATGDPRGDGGEEPPILSSGEGTEPADANVIGKLKAIEIFEVDVYGVRRSWEPVRPAETKEQSKRWCMCAVLVRR